MGQEIGSFFGGDDKKVLTVTGLDSGDPLWVWTLGEGVSVRWGVDKM